MQLKDHLFAVYKPKGPTSHDIINRLRKITGEKRIGHAGTLDPLASGVLVVGVGREATKQLAQIVAKEKEYLATIYLGFNSTTDDEAGKKIKVEASTFPTIESVKQALKQFLGQISQTPPNFSAVKVQGQEAYKLAYKGKNFTLKPKLVEAKQIELLEYKWPFLKLKIVTGPGFYIRSLARDLGEKLKTGGYISELERIRVGNFTKEKAVRLEKVYS
ncbi:tRNA pseudouridine(55) synthase TruB [Candidatus Beckwithbacteria bacterium RBG_13_42_9]|uniref:tRNA pseudouridine synthase B n=1 Tax=Candidatus Beckwithbacteria bacterium RBG_13_42_9 TaxID=1797457 RepID=A0A1F5E6H8_9BACT|nr:MAG: tRNA pseudouridine(55) synthase TruB [Candidatus Beckwithbacteria bacterium RBG_13_42_9]